MNDMPLLGGLHCPQNKQGAAWAVLAWVALEMAWAAAGSCTPTIAGVIGRRQQLACIAKANYRHLTTSIASF